MLHGRNRSTSIFTRCTSISTQSDSMRLWPPWHWLPRARSHSCWESTTRAPTATPNGCCWTDMRPSTLWGRPSARNLALEFIPMNGATLVQRQGHGWGRGASPVPLGAMAFTMATALNRATTCHHFFSWGIQSFHFFSVVIFWTYEAYARCIWSCQWSISCIIQSWRARMKNEHNALLPCWR